MNIPNKRSSCFCFRALCFTLSAGAILTACSSTTTSTGAVTTPLTNTRKSSWSAGSWKTLFDGKSADAWRIYGKQTLPEGWQVKEGTLALVSKGAGDIITRDAYENFELELEWKISEGGNSGIFYPVVEAPKYLNTYHKGPEIQILDNKRQPDAKAGKNGNRTAGSNYDLILASQPSKPASAWNQVKLVINKGRVVHGLDGTKIVDYQLWSPEWEKMVAGSKFANMSDYSKAKKGPIALQDHGDPVWFRNIGIRAL